LPPSLIMEALPLTEAAMNFVALTSKLPANAA